MTSEIELGNCDGEAGALHPFLELRPTGPYRYAYVCRKCDRTVLIVDPRIVVVGNK